MHAIRDPEAPEYFRETFPEDRFPVYVWEGHPPALPETVWMSDTTHRDGQQGGVPLSAELGLEIYDTLSDFTGASGAVRHCEFFVYRESDRQALAGALERYRSGAPIEPTTWLRARREDVERIRRMGIRETGLLASSSDYHTFHKFKPAGRRAAAERYLEAVALALDVGIRPRVHLEDTTRSPMDFVLPFVEAVLELAAPYGPQLAPRFRICDTLGVGLPDPEIAAPRGIPAIFRALKGLGLGPEALEFHPHNDTWLVVANCLAAIREGCGTISGTFLGKGERTGNAPLEGVLVHLLGMGYFAEAPPDFRVLNRLAALYERIGHPLPPKYPLFGRDAHRTRAGIHADGLNKFWPMYAPFNVPALLDRSLEVSLTKDSGAAGILYLLRQHRSLDLPKADPLVGALQDWVQHQFDAGRSTGIEWEELAPVVDRLLAGTADRGDRGNVDRDA